MRKWGLDAIGLLAITVLAQGAPPVPGQAEAGGGLNDNLVTPDGAPIGIRITVGFFSDHIGSESAKPEVARIVTADGRELRGFAFTEGADRGALVCYLDEFTLMVREQKEGRLGTVFAPRLREKLRRVSEETADGRSVSRPTYDGRPLTEAESYAFRMYGWIADE